MMKMYTIACVNNPVKSKFCCIFIPKRSPINALASQL